MKILALRGENLASLAAPFEIDFEVPPLKDAGVYAICGPTGAGKSTLLDALCLALYHRTPRLDEGATASVQDAGGEAIQARDPRQWLRRGAVSGHAEVDFVGLDGQRWRARWSVKRARSRRDGKLQAAEASLVALASGERRGRTISEVREAIRDCVGLDFAQFTRAVLLAQNQFARFLAADPNERAELLEALTGAQIYSQLSQAAFERARDSQQALALLERSLQAQAPLSDEAIQGLQAETQALSIQEQALREQLGPLQAGLAWHRQRALLESESGTAADALQQLRAQVEASAEAARELQFWLLAAQARPLLHAEQQAQARAQTIQTELHAADAAQAQAGAALVAAQHALAVATEHEQQAAAELQTARPLLDQAHVLDRQIAAADAKRASAEQECARQQRRVAQIESALQQEVASAQQQQAQLDQILLWCAARIADAELCANWARLEMQLGQVLAVQDELAAAQSARMALRAHWQHSAAALKSAQQSQQQASDNVRVLQDSLQQASTHLDALDLAGLQADQAAHLGDQQTLLRLRHAWADAQRSRDDCSSARREHAELLEQRGIASAAVAQLQAELPGLEAGAHTSRSLSDAAQASANRHTEVLRGHLQDGQPCPVCGATEHPYRSAPPPPDPALAEILAGLRQAAETAESALQAARTALRDQQRQIAQHDAQLPQHAARLQRLQEAAQQAAAQLRQFGALAEWLQLPPSLTDCDLAQPLQHQEQILATRAVTLAARSDAVRCGLAERDRLQQAQTAAAQQLALADAQLREVQRTHTQVEADGQQLSRDCDRLQRALEQIRQALQQETGWPVGMHAQTLQSSDRQALATRVQHWQSHASERDTLSASVEQHERQRAMLQEQLAQEAPTLARHQSDCAAAELDLAALRSNRRAVHEDSDTQAWEQRLQRALDTARVVLVQAHESQAHAHAGAAISAQRQARIAQSCGDAHEHAAQATQVVESWLAAQQQAHPRLSRDLLQDALQVPEASVQQRRQQQLDLQRQLQDAELAVAQAGRRLAQWLGEGAPAAAQEQLQTALEALQHTLDQLLERRGGLGEQLAADQRLRERQHTLLQQIDSARDVHRTWAQLSELIGSADGARFRRLAQQYTLDLVLAYTNVHLRELSPRYQLRREGENLLVVDADLGDAIRAASSLSGGETFLVSLGLALGLASLTAQRLRIESLFIDEGFGALDEHSLRLALDALDRLQAQGRKVGVISHLPELTERVGTRIEVRRVGHGASVVEVRG